MSPICLTRYPETESLMDKGIHYLYAFGKKGYPEYEFYWCQGEVI